MGDPNVHVSAQIEELRQQLRTAANGSHARMARIEEQVTRLTDAFTTVTTISFQRGHAAGAAGQPLAVVRAPGPGGPAHRRRRVITAMCAAAAFAAAGYGVWAAGDDPPAAPPGSAPLTASRDLSDPHGPASYPPTPRPNPTVTDVHASAAPGGPSMDPGQATGVPAVVRDDQEPGVAPEATPLSSVASPPAVESDCRLGVQIRRVSVCRGAAK